METLLSDIEKFTAKNGLSEWQFGELALNDRHFIRQLREGRDLRMSTVDRVKSFMRSYRPAKARAA